MPLSFPARNEGDGGRISFLLLSTTGGNGVYCLPRGIGMGWGLNGIGLIAWVHSEIDLSVDSSPFKMIIDFLLLCLSASAKSICPR